MDRFRSKIIIKSIENIKDAQGQALESILKKTTHSDFSVKSGKFYELEVLAIDENKAKELIENVSKDILSNPVIEQYEILEIIKL